MIFGFSTISIVGSNHSKASVQLVHLILCVPFIPLALSLPSCTRFSLASLPSLSTYSLRYLARLWIFCLGPFPILAMQFPLGEERAKIEKRIFSAAAIALEPGEKRRSLFTRGSRTQCLNTRVNANTLITFQFPFQQIFLHIGQARRTNRHIQAAKVGEDSFQQPSFSMNER